MHIYKIPDPPAYLTHEEHSRLYREWYRTQVMNAQPVSFEEYLREARKEKKLELNLRPYQKEALEKIRSQPTLHTYI